MNVTDRQTDRRTLHDGIDCAYGYRAVKTVVDMADNNDIT